MTREEAERLLCMGSAGVNEWNRRRAEGDLIPKLREVVVLSDDLTGINLSGVRLLAGWFVGVNLSSADCRGAILYGGNFGSAVLRGACFVRADIRHSLFGIFSAGLGPHSGPKADLSNADFSYSRLCHSDLSETVLDGTLFCRADLTKADLRDSDTSRTVLTDARLDLAVGHSPTRFPQGPPRVHFGRWLKERREALGLTPDEMAAELGCGLAGHDVTAFMEAKEEGVHKDLAIRLSRVLGVPVPEVPQRRDA